MSVQRVSHEAVDRSRDSDFNPARNAHAQMKHHVTGHWPDAMFTGSWLAEISSRRADTRNWSSSEEPRTPNQVWTSGLNGSVVTSGEPVMSLIHPDHIRTHPTHENLHRTSTSCQTHLIVSNWSTSSLYFEHYTIFNNNDQFETFLPKLPSFEVEASLIRCFKISSNHSSNKTSTYCLFPVF